MKLSEQLKAAFTLIDREDKWCQGEYARDKDGNYIPEGDKNACKYCSLGAIRNAQEIDNISVHSNFIRLSAIRLIDKFNDNHTYAEVREVWLKAIAKAKEEEK